MSQELPPDETCSQTQKHHRTDHQLKGTYHGVGGVKYIINGWPSDTELDKGKLKIMETMFFCL